MTAKNAASRVPIRLRFSRTILRFVFRGVFRLLFNIELEGFENIPQEGGYAAAYNHISLFEPPLILAFWPKAPEGISALDVFTRPWQKVMVSLYGAIAINRKSYDREGMDTINNLLKTGNAMIISPEGGRSHDLGMRSAQPGIAFILDRAQVPILPIAILGTHDESLKNALRGNRETLTIRVGKPFILPPINGKGEQRRAERQKNADEVMLAIGRMLPEKYHGVYAGKI